jgi:hypothetical protein
MYVQMLLRDEVFRIVAIVQGVDDWTPLQAIPGLLPRMFQRKNNRMSGISGENFPAGKRGCKKWLNSSMSLTEKT